MSDADEINRFLQAGFAAAGWGKNRRPIMCAQCQKPVERMRQEDSRRDNTVIFTVWCHGDKDTCYLTQEQLVDKGDTLEAGYAFTTRRIEDAVERSGESDDGGVAEQSPQLNNNGTA